MKKDSGISKEDTAKMNGEELTKIATVILRTAFFVPWQRRRRSSPQLLVQMLPVVIANHCCSQFPSQTRRIRDTGTIEKEQSTNLNVIANSPGCQNDPAAKSAAPRDGTKGKHGCGPREKTGKV